MRDFDDFLPFIIPYASSAPEPVIFRCLRDVAIQFCERTRLWRETDTIETNGEEPEPIAVPDDAILYEIASCSIDDLPLDPISLQELAKDTPDWRTQAVGSCNAKWYVSPERGTIQTVPRASGTLFVEFIAKPKIDALTLPDFLYDEYASVLGDGAAGCVLMTPSAAYANPQLGAALYAKFTSKIGSLSNAGLRGQQRAPTRTKARFL